MSVDSKLIREAAQNYSFDSQSILYIGEYVGYKDAPNPQSKEVKRQRDEIISELEQEYPVTIEKFNTREQHEIMIDQFKEGDLPDWYDGPNSIEG